MRREGNRMRSWQILSACALSAALCLSAALVRADTPAAGAAAAVEGDHVIRDFHFASGESLPELRLHYTVLGKPRRDSHGRISNAVLILQDRKSTRLNSSHGYISYAVFC